MIHEKISLRNSENVYMETYITDDCLDKNTKRPLVVICPGGGYNHCSKREAEPVALSFNAKGIHAVVVYYSLNKLFPASLEDLSKAVVLVRENAEKWNVDENKIILCGFSAGGHLAASLGVFWDNLEGIKRKDMKNKPNGMILSYPVITSGEKAHRGSIDTISGNDKDIKELVSLEKRVTKSTPPVFIWHTFTDELVPVENSIYMIEALAKNKIPTEAHIYPKGIHGLSLGTDVVAAGDYGVVEEVQGWIIDAIRWIKNL
ncbi:MAG: alpha/beta hydrolase [Clostridia bacterium]